MSRTYRGYPKSIPNGSSEFRWAWCGFIRVENRKARDGKAHSQICGSAAEGKLNTYDDCSRGYGKRTANKQIRRYHKHDLKQRVLEHIETCLIEALELARDEWVYWSQDDWDGYDEPMDLPIMDDDWVDDWDDHAYGPGQSLLSLLGEYD